MDFHKLSNFQLYSIINSRHLDSVQKAAAQSELERRNLTPEELQQFADELSSRQHQPKWSAKVSPTVLWLLVISIVLFFLKQASCR
jgi:anthranilate phosphoribosyltransferase